MPDDDLTQPTELDQLKGMLSQLLENQNTQAEQMKAMQAQNEALQAKLKVAEDRRASGMVFHEAGSKMSEDEAWKKAETLGGLLG